MKKLNGMTFIEILIAIVIVAIILSTMLTGMNFGIKYARHNANKTMALNFAQGLMEEIKDKDYEDKYATNPNYHTGDYTSYLGPELNIVDTIEYDDDTNEDNFVDRSEFDDVDDYNGYSDTVNLYQKESVNIEADRTVEIMDQDGNSTLDSGEYADIEYKQIRVTVSWAWQGKLYTEEANTLRSDY